MGHFSLQRSFAAKQNNRLLDKAVPMKYAIHVSIIRMTNILKLTHCNH